MTGNIANENGNVVIDSEVIAEYAGHAALDCFGIIGMASISVKDGLAKLLKSERVSHGVIAELDQDNNITIDFHIIITYGVNIKTVVDNLKSTVKYQVEEFTGFKVKAINVFVEGVRVID